MWNGVVTNLGLSLLEQWAAGSETLYIDKATAGSGTVAQSNMRGSTYVQGEVCDVSIVASIPVTGGTQYRIQVSANPDAAYIMHQIGIWAHLGASGGTTLLALYQDEDGVNVPLAADAPGFGFTLYAVVSMSNQGSVTVNFDGGAYVTRNDMSETLKGYVQTVNGNAPAANGNVTLPVDTAPTQGSQNPVTSGGAYTALSGKQNTLTFDTTPTSGSQNPVTSGGVYSAIDILHTKNAGFHNSIFRGKNLGASVTSAQWNVISSGTFDDLFIGDCWTINGVVWRIAAFDYWYNCGDAACTTHHVVIVPDANLVAADDSTTHWMNATDTTKGAYVGSDFYTGNNGNTGKSQCTTKINSAFGAGHILTHREYLQNAVKDGYGSAGAWYDSTLECMTEQMVYGGKVFGDIMHGTNIPASYTIGKSQLPLFALAPSFICNRAGWWLRDVVSASYFAVVAIYGDCTSTGAARAWVGLRPAFGIRA